MTKREFIKQLSKLLHELNYQERIGILKDYERQIDEDIARGFTEREAVERLGDVFAVAERELQRRGMKSTYSPQGKADNKGCGTVFLVVLAILSFPLWGGLSLILLIMGFALLIAIFCPFLILGALLFVLATGGIFTTFAFFGLIGGIVFRVGFVFVLIGFLLLFMPLYQNLFFILSNFISALWGKFKLWIGRYI